MSESCKAGTVSDLSGINEAVCIHTKKITDSCRDKDCIEDLRVYLTKESQSILDCSTAAKARCAELLHVYIDVEPVSYSQGYFSVDITYYYRIIADAIIGGVRPSTIYGLAVFTKRVILCGGTGGAKIFTSQTCLGELDRKTLMSCNLPTAVVEVLDPMILSASVLDACDCHCCCCDNTISELPSAICRCFGDELVLSGEAKRLFVTIGQFSIIRLERDTQLLIPTFDYCIPAKDCSDSAVSAEESPCDMFAQIDFPVGEFFPGDCEPRSVGGASTGCGCSSGYKTCG